MTKKIFSLLLLVLLFCFLTPVFTANAEHRGFPTGDGDCCIANGTPSCEDPVCVQEICITQQNPGCCTGVWNSMCAAEAKMFCSDLCFGFKFTETE